MLCGAVWRGVERGKDRLIIQQDLSLGSSSQTRESMILKASIQAAIQVCTAAIACASFAYLVL